MGRKKKVIAFVQDGVGGAERMTTLIGKSLNSDRFDLCFCIVERAVKSSIIDFIPDNIRKIWIPDCGALLLILKMAKVLLKEKPDVVFSSVFNLNNKLLVLKWLTPHSTYIIRCDNYLYTYSDKQRRILLKTYPKADVLIAQTEEMGTELIVHAGVSADRVKVLHNPIDKALIDERLCGASNPYQKNEKKHFVAVGRFNPQKGFDLLIDAFIIVAKGRSDVDLHIVGDESIGDGKVAEVIRSRAEEAGISDLVFFHGYKDNPFPYIKYADCFVLSSRWEGLPNVLIESLYLGTPVAAFKCIPIIERIVTEGVTGFLAEKDNIDDLSAAMLSSLKLGRVVSSYKSASISDFVELFQS
ncbi:glycosyltransferase [Prevotella communis]|uniref:glycosyltransferase n=1 Tax=Prevotella communis TaxID=2913614 RepID=UPI001EDC3679|nr:glycosyltransferase [Prevotella communis]UKK59602.1 glycosyltransferase [Prevotella communis]